MRIRKLPVALANQIAAGEVIERPASIVKELLENAWDARASMIQIDIGYGGLNQIKVTDNGLGIVAEDLPLALLAHATSKIFELNDLYAIESMGFRGEALASIASIAHVSVLSRPAEQDVGMMLRYEKGEYVVTPKARAVGTTVDVCDMFYNAPVRKRFLKSARVEYQAIETLVKRFALAAPAITLILTHNEVIKLSLQGALDSRAQQNRIMKVLGKSFIEKAITVDITHDNIHVHGFISGLDCQRSQGDKLWVYINGRMVRDPLINHAIRQAYADLLYPGRFPSCLLYITMPPEQIDVNVHPTKHEVRFQDARLMHDLICSQLREYLHATPIIPDVMHSSSYQKNTRVESTPMTYVPLYTQVNRQFGVLSLDQQSFLVDLAALYQHYLSHQLQVASRPLTHRPLLVPVYYKISLASVDERLKKSEILQEMGIQVALLKDEWMIKTLPLLAENVNLTAFLNEFFSCSIAGAEEAITLLVKHQLIDISQLTEEQGAACQAYFTANPVLQHSELARPLSHEACQRFLKMELV